MISKFFQEFGSLKQTQKFREQLRKMLLCFRFKFRTLTPNLVLWKAKKTNQTQIQRTDRKFQFDPHPNTSAANPNNFLPVPLSKHRSKALLYIWSHSCDARIRHEGVPYFQRCNCLWAYLVHIRALQAQPQTPVPDKPHLWNSCLVSHFIFYLI